MGGASENLLYTSPDVSSRPNARSPVHLAPCTGSDRLDWRDGRAGAAVRPTPSARPISKCRSTPSLRIRSPVSMDRMGHAQPPRGDRPRERSSSRRAMVGLDRSGLLGERVGHGPRGQARARRHHPCCQRGPRLPFRTGSHPTHAGSTGECPGRMHALVVELARSSHTPPLPRHPLVCDSTPPRRNLEGPRPRFPFESRHDLGIGSEPSALGCV